MFSQNQTMLSLIGELAAPALGNKNGTFLHTV